MWQQLSQPQYAAHQRLFFEMYGQALQGRPGTTGMLEGIVGDWLDPAEELVRAKGVPEETARAAARLGLAVSRGLLLDLLATGDREGVDAAMEAYLRVLELAPGA
jgi:hypothetical protein